MLYRITYNLILNLSYPVLKFLGLFSDKIRLFILGRKEVFYHLESLEVNKGDWVWFHVASLGEFEQARPLIYQYKLVFPMHKILLTFFSSSGYEIEKKFDAADCICYLPWDTIKNVNQFLDFCNIRRAIFIKYEFWLNFFNGLSKRKIPIYLVSSIFRPNQLFFKNYGKSYREILFFVKHFFVQNDESKKLLNSIGIDQVSVSGDTRLDRVYNLTQDQDRLETIERFLNGQECFVAGSTWPEDYDLMYTFLKKTCPIKIIIAPHNVSKRSIENLEKRISVPYTKWSNFHYSKTTDKAVMIIDTIGQLNKIYRYAKFAYVGGGMKKSGLHNTLEPAAYGIPVIIGKYYRKFQEAVLLEKKGGIKSVQSTKEFKKAIETLIKYKAMVNRMGSINKDYVTSGKGVSQRVINTIKKHSLK